MNDLVVTHINLPADDDSFGLFKAGFKKVIYRFTLDENGDVHIENGVAFLQDTEFSKKGKTIDLTLPEVSINKYKDELQYLIESGIINNIEIID